MQDLVQPTSPAPAQPPVPPVPSPPGPFASRQEWRAWRRQQRAYIRAQWHSYGPWGWFGIWSWFWGLALVITGGYYLLVNLGVVNWPNAGEILCPSFLILLGVLLLASRIGRNRP